MLLKHCVAPFTVYDVSSVTPLDLTSHPYITLYVVPPCNFVRLEPENKAAKSRPGETTVGNPGKRDGCTADDLRLRGHLIINDQSGQTGRLGRGLHRRPRSRSHFGSRRPGRCLLGRE